MHAETLALLTKPLCFPNMKYCHGTTHGRIGVILFGGGAQYSLPEQANLTLIFCPKIVGERGGRSPKKIFRTYYKTFFRTHLHTFYKIFQTLQKKFT